MDIRNFATAAVVELLEVTLREVDTQSRVPWMRFY